MAPMCCLPSNNKKKPNEINHFLTIEKINSSNDNRLNILQRKSETEERIHELELFYKFEAKNFINWFSNTHNDASAKFNNQWIVMWRWA